MRFGLRPVSSAAVEHDQIRVRLRDRRIERQRRFVRRDRAAQIACIGELQAALQIRLRVVSQ
jgi:hypothetical protein